MQRRGLRNLVCLGISEGNNGSNNAIGRLLPVARFMILKLLVVPLVMVGIVRSMPKKLGANYKGIVSLNQQPI